MKTRQPILYRIEKMVAADRSIVIEGRMIGGTATMTAFSLFALATFVFLYFARYYYIGVVLPLLIVPILFASRFRISISTSEVSLRTSFFGIREAKMAAPLRQVIVDHVDLRSNNHDTESLFPRRDCLEIDFLGDINTDYGYLTASYKGKQAHVSMSQAAFEAELWALLVGSFKEVYKQQAH